MKVRVLFLLFFLTHLFVVAVAQPTAAKISSKSVKKTPPRPPQRFAKIVFEEMTYDWGTVKEDSIFVKDFKFKNTGNKELIILDARGSCGCTSPTYPNSPILPGETGVISVKYVAKNKVGPQKPVITITSNATPETSRLFMEGWVHQIPGGVN